MAGKREKPEEIVSKLRQVEVMGEGMTIANAVRKNGLTMIRVDRKLNSTNLLDALTDLFILRGPLEYIRSNNGPAFIALKVWDWIAAVGSKTA